MANRLYGKIAAALLALAVCAASVLPLSAEKGNAAAESSAVSTGSSADSGGYSAYRTRFTADAYSGDDITVSADKYSASADAAATVETVSENKNTLVLKSCVGEISYSFDVAETAFYCISLTYLPLESSSLKPGLKVLIDGASPFEEAGKIELERFWKNADNEKHADSVGNEYSADQVLYNGFVKRELKDTTGIITGPYEFELTAGRHTVTLAEPTQALALSEIALTAPEVTSDYAEVSKQYGSYGKYTGSPIVIEGENAELKSSMSLMAKSDNSSLDINPSSATVSLLNYIGGTTWKSAGDELVWSFEAPSSGLYKIGFSFKQSDVTNGYVYRHLKIDGRTPFKEAGKIKFNYSTSWQFKALSTEDNEPCLIYLEKGKHTLSLTAVLGDMSGFYVKLSDLLYQISQVYLDIVMITGESPDSNRDYDLFKQIPNFNETLEKLSNELAALSKDMEAVTSGDGSQYTSTINSMVRVLNEMLKNPYSAQKYLSEYSTQYTSLGTVLSDMTAMPLKLDAIRLAAPDGKFENSRSNIFSRCAFGIKRFAASFIGDYNSVSVTGDKSKQLKIWCNWGRDQAMVLNNLIQQSFTAKTGIGVNLELTNASLINGIVSNTQPDLQLHMARTEPVNLAIRRALYDLSEFSDYEEVMKRFGESAGIPYEYGDGHYALPDTQGFYIMFYRTDIFNKLGLTVPNTWDEFLNVAAKIMRNNMTVYLPYTQITATTTVNTGVGALNLFSSIMQQYGEGMYNSERNASNLLEPVALSAFSFWTEMYTKYKVPTAQSFYNRFKAGTCPLGIETYTQYTQISQAAPEIDGLWNIALIPGVKNQDGTVNRTVSGSGTGCGILGKSEHKEEAWKFLKWWTSAETQLSYNNGVESILGSISRTSTATIEAFENMSWDSDAIKVLLEQRKQIVEIPEVPGSYYVARAVDQAFWTVVNGQSNEKDALIKWGEIANNEIERKIKQYDRKFTGEN